MLPKEAPFRVVGSLLICRESSSREFRVVSRATIGSVVIVTPDPASAKYTRPYWVKLTLTLTQYNTQFQVSEEELFRFLRWIEASFPPKDVLMIEDDTAFENAYRSYINQTAAPS